MADLIPSNIQIPAHLAKRMGQPSVLAQSIGGGIGMGVEFPRISIKGSRFRIVEGDSEVVIPDIKLDVVIVGANPRLSKTWYAKKWTPDAEPAAPDCYSLDGVAPHPESANKQNDLCATCEHNAWGSATNPTTGAKMKACSDQKRLAVVAADDPTGPVYLLQVTPAALKGLNTYQRELVMRGIAPEIVKTRISFDTNASFPKLEFGFGGFLDEDTMAAVDSLFDSDKVKMVTGEVSVAAAPVAAPSKPKPQLVAPDPVPAPAPEPVAEPAAPKRGFGAKAAAPAAAPKAAKPAPVAATSGNIADEIEAMLKGAADDE